MFSDKHFTWVRAGDRSLLRQGGVLTLVLASLLLPSRTHGQSGETSDSSVRLATPELLISTVGTSELLRKAHAIAELVGAKEGLEFVDRALAPFTDGSSDIVGVDPQGRFGLCLYELATLQQGVVPRLLGFIPVKDPQRFLERIAGTFPLRRGGRPDLFVVAAGFPLWVRVSGAHCWVATREADLTGNLPDPRGLLAGAVGRHDVAVRVDFRALPREVKEKYVEQQMAEGARLLGRLDGMPLLRGLKSAALRGLKDSWAIYLDGARALTVSFDFDLARRHFALETEIEAERGSRLQEMLAEYGKISSRFRDISKMGGIASLSVSMPIPAEQRQTLQSLVYSLRSLGRGDGAQTGEDLLFSRFCDVLEENVRSGHVDAGLSFDAKAGSGVVLAAGVRMLESRELENIVLKVARTFATPENGFEKLVLAEARWDSTAVHGLYPVALPDDVAQLLGKNAAIHFAFPTDAVLLAAGSRSSDTLSALYRATSRSSAAGQRFFDLHIDVRRLVNLVHTTRPSPQTRAFLGGPSADVEVRAIGELVGQAGMRFRVEISENLISALVRGSRER